MTQSPFNMHPMFGHYGGVSVVEVEPGTVIEKDGEKLTVDDTQMVSKDGKFYVTAKHMALIKARTEPRTPPGPGGITGTKGRVILTDDIGK